MRRQLRSTDGGIDFALGSQPIEVAFFSPLFDFSKQLNGFGFVARLARIVRRYHHRHFDGDDIFVGLNESRSLNTFAGNSHD